MRESRLYGFVRGARGNPRPYREVRQRSWRGPAGESPAQVRRSSRLIVSVAVVPVTARAKRTQQSSGVGY